MITKILEINDGRLLMKKTPALIAAFVMTALVAAGMLLMGTNALFNPSSVALADSPAAGEAAVAPASAEPLVQEQQLQQLQALVAQYQAREQQYQQELNQLQQQASQTNDTLQQYQLLLQEMQRRGLVQIGQNGQVTLPRGITRGGDH
jgi:hypothetical protein